MRITGITSRIISYDVSAIYGDAGPPQEISAVYRYSYDTIHTDEGIDGHSMQFGWMGEGQAMGHALHQAYGRFLLGRARAGHPAISGRTRSGRAGLPAVPGRGWVLLLDRGPGRGLCARRAELPLVRGTTAGPPGVPAQAAGGRDPNACPDDRNLAA